MAKFLVTYDLVGTDETSEDYAKLIKRIKRFRYRKVQKSVWVIESGRKAGDIRDMLWALMDANDRLYVTRIARGAGWRNPICGSAKLKEFLRS